jgi:hypothetical protein
VCEVESGREDAAAQFLAHAMKVHGIAFGGDAYWMAIR